MGPGMDSTLRLLTLLLSMEMTVAQTIRTPRFGLFVPPDLYHPSTAKLCLHLEQQEHQQISVDLETSSGSVTLHTVQPDSPTWQCPSFQVPKPADATEKATIIIHGQESGGKKVELSSQEVTLRKKNIGTFIQSDKAVYKPGQTVMFRFVTLDQDFEVLNKTYPLVELQDPQKNRIAQWKDVSGKSGIAELSYPLSPDSALGTYDIKTEESKLSFTIDEYVLPKFDVFIEGPSSISILDDKVSMSVSALYTYGEKVPGNVTLKVSQKKRPRYWGWRMAVAENDDKEILSFTHNGKTDHTGKLTLAVDLSQFRLRDSNYQRQLEVEVSLEEDGTGVAFSAPQKVINLHSQLTKITFKDIKRYYQPGAPYRGKLVLESYDGKRLDGKKVQLRSTVRGETTEETYVTDSAGEVSFHLSSEKWGEGSVSLRATTDEKDEPYLYSTVSVRYGSAYLYLEGMHVVSNSSVYIQPVKSTAQSDGNVKVTVDYILEEQEGDDIEFFYLTLLDNRVTLGGQKTVQKVDGLSGSFQLSIPAVEISPSGKILVFTVSQSGGIAADTTEVQMTASLKHKVSLKFSEEEALPGSDVQLLLKANGGSLCAVRAVDKSVVMMKPEAELTGSTIKNLVKATRSYIPAHRPHYDYCRDFKPETAIASDNADDVTGWWGGYSYPEKKKDLKNIVQDMGLHLVTSWDVVAPTTCIWHSYSYEMFYDGEYDMPISAAPAFLLSSPADTSFDVAANEEGGSSSNPRIFFPETWLFDLVPVLSTGSAELLVSVPDTITTWSTQMFCVGPEGFGLSSPVDLKAFQPFFVDLILPYSVIRGESFLLKVSVFNYMSHAMKIDISLPSSEQLRIKNEENSKKSFYLIGGGKKTTSFDVTPMTLGEVNITIIAEAVNSKELYDGQELRVPRKGRRDVVIKTVLVVAEGTEVVQTHNSLLISDGHSVSETVRFQLPSSYVPGSERAFISVCGDILGPSLSNIGNLLAMSYGCGEQNMILFAPNVFILKYLKSSNQLNPTIIDKGKNMLKQGYARQHMYKRLDGSYSAFGNSDSEGSTWLTGFVVKTFSQSKDFTYIDETTLTQSMDWMKAQQKPDGCFQAKGRVLQNGMQGGMDDEVSLTTYITIALLEAGLDPSDVIVQRALKCITNETLEKASLYKLALKSYAFTLSGQDENRAAALERLYQKATIADGVMYWTQEPRASSNSYWSKPMSVDVEMSSYVLLALSYQQNPTKKQLGEMASISRWLNTQRNANGGFSSTQDTVVALQALANFGAHLFRKSGNMTVDLTSENGFRHRFHVNNDNRLLLQKTQLPEIPGEYTMTVSGNGNVVMQAVQRHNVLPAPREDAFVMSATPQCVKSDVLQISVEFRYSGKRRSTNMVLMKIDMLSGFVPLQTSLDDLMKNPSVKRVEKEKDGVYIYIDKVTSEPQTLELQAEQTVPVTGRKASIIKMCDYYMPEEEQTISYLINC
ncbi:alpha-2-macroglobulin-like protein 1 [Ranitomeya variabilis]|uniref:alpha-2-macroglobulin-like protein 1 n=1 Tax=Ranitomeya variabilis TaxID=490064 RepID=UPI0040569840